MKKEQELLKQLTEMVRDTRAGKIFWKVDCQTTEYNAPENKPQVVEDGITWNVDECYVSYYCEYKGKEFLLITYEMIHSAPNQIKTTNLVFLPPMGIRYFDIHTLLPYAVEPSQMLNFQLHELWNLVLDMQKNKPQALNFQVSERVLTIED